MEQIQSAPDQARRVLASLGVAFATRSEQDRFTTRARKALSWPRRRRTTRSPLHRHGAPTARPAREGDGVAARVLSDLGVQLQAARAP